MAFPQATRLQPDPSSQLIGGPATAAALALLATVLVWHIMATIALPGERWVMPDLAVYRAAVDAALGGQPVYLSGLTDRNLPWLYPPFALVVLAPLAWLSETGAKVTISGLSVAALAYSCRVSWRATTVDRNWLLPLTIATTAILLASEPMQGNLMMGQVNVALAAAVLTDVLLPAGHRFKGLLVGLATGIKLTPALVIVYYILKRDWPAARRSAMTFAGTVLLGALCFPGQSWAYWTQAVLANRIGPAHLGNQSLLGVMLRLGALAGVDESAVRTGWVLLVVALCLSAMLLLARLNPDPLGTYCGLAAITLLVSPLSWTPHWISLAVPMVIWIAGRQPRLGRVITALIAAGPLLFAWPVDGVWSGLVWLVYPENYWSDAYPLVRTAGWIAIGSLYSALGTAALLMILTSAFRQYERPAPPRLQRLIVTTTSGAVLHRVCSTFTCSPRQSRTSGPLPRPQIRPSSTAVASPTIARLGLVQETWQFPTHVCISELQQALSGSSLVQ